MKYEVVPDTERRFRTNSSPVWDEVAATLRDGKTVRIDATRSGITAALRRRGVTGVKTSHVRSGGYTVWLEIDA